jgi:hypothetical protein
VRTPREGGFVREAKNVTRYRWLVFTNCTPGREADFNRWYDEVHIGDLLRVPGVVAARRARLAEAQMSLATGEFELCGPEEIGARFRFVAIYEIEADDPTAVLREIKRRANTPEMEISPHLAEAFPLLYQDC